MTLKERAYHLLQLYGLNWHPNSGKSIWRYKVGEAMKFIKHKGVVVGQDEHGQQWVIHNHSDTDMDLIPLDEFAKGKGVHFDDQPAEFSQPERVVRAFDELSDDRPYDKLGNNCQDTVSRITTGENGSEDRRRIVTGSLVGLGLLGLAALLLSGSGDDDDDDDLS